jgi:septin family protein
LDNLKKQPKTLTIYEVGMISLGGNFPACVHLYDTPGYGDDINNQDSFDRIRNNLLERHERFVAMQAEAIYLTEEERKSRDDRIHCCLYFFAPHRVKKIDENFILSLADLTVIVPIVAKADTMTMEERAACLDDVVARLERINGKVAKQFGLRSTFNFDQKGSAGFFKSKQAALDAIANKKPEDEVPEKNTVTMPARKIFKHNDDSEEEGEEEPEPIIDIDSSSDAGEPVYAGLGDVSPAIVNSGCVQKMAVAVAVCTADDNYANNPAAEYTIVDDSHRTTPTGDASIARFKNIFSIVADPHMCRVYPWGTCKVMDVQHSDFPLLQEKLFHYTTMKSMLEATRERTGKLMQRKTAEAKAKTAEEEAQRAEEETQKTKAKVQRVEEEASRLGEEAQRAVEEAKKAALPVAFSPRNRVIWEIVLAMAILFLFIAVIKGAGDAK